MGLHNEYKEALKKETKCYKYNIQMKSTAILGPSPQSSS